MAVAIPKLRIKIGPEGPIRIYQTFSDSLKKKNHSTDEQSKKCGPKPKQLENLQSKTKQYTPPDLRTALAKAQFILNAKYKNVPDKSNKSSSYQVRLQMEKEEMERTQLEEKARIEAEIRAAKIDARLRAQTELKQKREKQRIELAEMKPSFYFEESHLHRKMEKEVFGGSSLTEIRLLFAKYTGLSFKNDESLEEMEIELEEGEIV